MGKSKKVRIKALCVCLASLLLVCTGCSSVKTITTSQFQKAIDVQELSAAEFVYNGVAEYPHNGKIIYIKYGSKVKAGIDFSDIVFSVDTETKVIDIILPEVEILDVNIEISMIDYMPSSPDIELQEVIRVCKKDVKDHAVTESIFFQTATNNLKSTISALIRPLLSDDNYVINFYGTKV